MLPVRVAPPGRRGRPAGAAHSTAERDCRWCWTGVSGWGRVAPQGCPGVKALGRAVGKWDSVTLTFFDELEGKVKALEGKVDTLQSTTQEGFGIVLDELRGLRDDVKQARGASSVEYAQLREKN